MRAQERRLPATTVVHVRDLARDLPAASFDFIVGTAILCHDRYAENLRVLYSLLKPGGQLLFFEANLWNPQVLLKNTIPPLGRMTGQASCQIGMRRYRLLQETSRQGLVEVEVIPYDILHPRTPASLIRPVQSVAFVLEHIPGIRELCGTLYIWARRPGDDASERPAVNLALHPQLHRSTSVVVPCHNEARTCAPSSRRLLAPTTTTSTSSCIVDDHSTDGTADVVRELAAADPRVRLVIERRGRPGWAARSARATRPRPASTSSRWTATSL